MEILTESAIQRYQEVIVEKKNKEEKNVKKLKNFKKIKKNAYFCP